jgi:RNA-directed DNA polymerase
VWRTSGSLEEIARYVNPRVRGWVNYYGQFYRSELGSVLRCLERSIARWAQKKYKRLKRHKRRAVHWLGHVARREPRLFVHWQFGVCSATGQ